jgi:hypothetical protein
LTTVNSNNKDNLVVPIEKMSVIVYSSSDVEFFLNISDITLNLKNIQNLQLNLTIKKPLFPRTRFLGPYRTCLYRNMYILYHSIQDKNSNWDFADLQKDKDADVSFVPLSSLKPEQCKVRISVVSTSLFFYFYFILFYKIQHYLKKKLNFL